MAVAARLPAVRCMAKIPDTDSAGRRFGPAIERIAPT